VGVGLEGVVVDCRVRGFRREVRLLNVVDAVLLPSSWRRRMTGKAVNVDGTRRRLQI